MAARLSRRQPEARTCLPELGGSRRKGPGQRPSVERAVRDRIEPLLEEESNPLVIGCIHFSFLKPVIEKVAGEKIELIEPAPAVAAQTARVSRKQVESGHLTLVASGGTEEFALLASGVAGAETSQPVLPFPS